MSARAKRMPLYEHARWFKPLGSCIACGKPATGELMTFNNDRIGAFCRKHGDQFAREAKEYANSEGRS